METATKTCKICRETKQIDLFPWNRLTCKVCANEVRKERKRCFPELEERANELRRLRFKNNEYRAEKNAQRREYYAKHEEFREKRRIVSSVYKKAKTEERQQKRQEEQEAIGLDNKLCKYCKIVKPKTRFRFNRRKCADCERDEPLEKFKRAVRSRIYICLNRKKSKSTIDYLGCTAEEYIRWLKFCDNSFDIATREGSFHIDHVIPLSKFDLQNVLHQDLAFNWRNTVCVPIYENLSKNDKIIPSQLRSHLEKLMQYHELNKIQLPQRYIDLFAKPLVAGSPLEPI